MRRACVILAVACSACSGTSGAPGDASDAVDAVPRERIMEVKRLRPGEIGETILTGGPRDRVVIHLATDVASLDFNVHGHDGSGTQVVHEELGIQSTEYTFVPARMDEWFVLFRNSDTAVREVEVTLELYGAMTWSGWQ